MLGFRRRVSQYRNGWGDSGVLDEDNKYRSNDYLYNLPG